MRHFPLVMMAMILAFSSCKSKDKKTEDNTAITDTKSTESKNASAAGDENKNARWEQRKAKGDTLALPYKDLQAYLPEISGYTKDGGPKGSQMNMPGMGSWSEGEQNYVSGEKRVSVKIVDYNASFQTFQGLTAMYSMAFSAEDDTKKQQKLDLGMKDVSAYETLYKTEKRAELVIVIADRFFVTIDSDGDNEEGFIKSVAKSINLEKMAGM